jgi:hypothetical protein
VLGAGEVIDGNQQTQNDTASTTQHKGAVDADTQALQKHAQTAQSTGTGTGATSGWRAPSQHRDRIPQLPAAPAPYEALPSIEPGIIGRARGGYSCKAFLKGYTEHTQPKLASQLKY